MVRPSPNFGERRGVERPDMIVLHYTGMVSGIGAENWLCDSASGVSSHYLIHEDGRIVQMVRERDRAWHAGKSFWKGGADINSHSVGLEIVNPGHQIGYSDFPRRQIDAVIALCQGIIQRHGIRAERVLAHSDVSPGRKVDPGEKFPWRVLFDAGVGHWVEPAAISDGDILAVGDRGAPVEELQRALEEYGYQIPTTGEFDAVTESVVATFQRHFRPARVDGIADTSTVGTLKKLQSSLLKPELY
ncbi:MAG TPA: N-acetylmuramoyl-L-alanine amidase [Rhizomicrobium sp.]|nr:N-acetylmuramoyl-L-alanine amidase [Rhizomicrobium sp.]